MLCDPQNLIYISDDKINYGENNFLVCIVDANGMALINAMASASTLMTSAGILMTSGAPFTNMVCTVEV